MSIHRILIPSSTSKFEQVVPLEGVNYIFRFRWNERAGKWFLTIRTSDGTDIVTGRKLVSRGPFAPHESAETLYPGVMWVLDVDQTGNDPGLSDLDDRVVLMYIDEDNVA